MLRDKAKTLPLTAGVYIMKSRSGEVLYVGKALCLRKRVASYFAVNRPPKTEALMRNTADIEYVECSGEAQALLLEAALIKERQPKYNIDLKDDKSYPYVEITQEKFPRLRLVRPRGKIGARLFGPYASAQLVRSALELIRKVFPYCSCRRMPDRPCLYYHLGLCPAPCQGKISGREYRANIANIRRILRGERLVLVKKFEEKMKRLAGANDFEQAAAVRDKLVALNELYGGRIQVHELVDLKNMLDLPCVPLEVEAVDISNISGTLAVGSLVVFRQGVPDKSSYRRFRVKNVSGADDFAMIEEVVRRRYQRLKAESQRFPDLLMVDGGQGQVRKAKSVLDRLGVSMPLVGLAKRNEELWLPGSSVALVISGDRSGLHFLQRVRDEAHRFAHSYHLLLRRKKLKAG